MIRSILTGIWRGLDGLRKILHLILLIVIFGAIAWAVSSSMPGVSDHTALVVQPQGRLVEQLSGDPVQRAVENARGQQRQETLLWDLVAAIRGAATDNRIRVLVLDLDQMDGAGQPMLEELARAIDAFRASGKPVIAYGTTYDQGQYYLAAQADKVYLDPTGYVMIEGYSRYPLYFKGLLQKLGVDVNVFRVGTFKSAVEIFTRSDMSPADKQQSLSYLNVLWSTYQKAMTGARKLPAGAIASYVDSLPKTVSAANGDAAKVALQAGLVTGLATRLQMDRQLIGLVGEDKSTGSFNQISAEDYARIVDARKKLHDGNGKALIGVIVASGEIQDGKAPPGTIGGDSLSRLIRDARLDKDIKAVVLRVDSPGGSVAASEEIYREEEALRAAGKPLVVSMGDLAASGGYYISAPANQIWASPATLTGSIGIFAIIPTIGQTLSKIGVSVDGVGTTPLAGALSITRPLTPEVSELLQSQIDRGYQQFVGHVAAGRRETPQQIDAIGQGRVWAGADARRIGLVDRLGTLEDAVKAAARLANVTQYQVEFVQPHLSWAEQLFQQAQARAAGAAVSLFAADAQSLGLAEVASQLSPVARDLKQLARFSVPGHLYSYCFCTASTH
ncbi:MAG TPA: signal peptide peptidase SppA [Steroidobacteraceae bacterium]|jgi:protease-4|nr:signal peptide peptidase SppA [Steroidobacteraceae bacterium]